MFYRAAPIACVGGSFTPKGGHNPIEPAQCGCAVLTGPDMSNFTDVASAMIEAGAMKQCPTPAALGETLKVLLQNPTQLEAMQAAAKDITAQPDKVLADLLAAMAPVLTPAGVRAT